MTEADAAAGEPTKRQVTKRKQKDPKKNVWMIQNTAKIQDPERRDLAYRRAAGMESKDVEQPKYTNFCRALGSSDHRTRHAAVRTLQEYLRERASKHGITELELKQISYAAWNTLYMADRVTVQDAVSKAVVKIVMNSLTGDLEEDEYVAAEFMRMKSAEEDEMQMDDDNTEISEPDEEEIDLVAKQRELIESDEEDEEETEDADMSTEMEVEDPEEEIDETTIPHCRGAHLASCFFRTFLNTIVKQWASMDKYRIDKFYTCLRQLLAELFRYLKERGWNPGLIRMFNDDLWNEVYTTVPNGIRYHVIDVFLEELVQVGGDSITEAIFLDIVQPLLSLARSGAGGDDTVHNRVMENVLAKFLDSYSVFRQDDDEPVFSQVHVGSIAAFIFELASDEDTTNPMYRKNLYDEYKRYTKRIQEVGEEKDVNLDDSEDEGQNGQEADEPEPTDAPVEIKEKRTKKSKDSSSASTPPREVANTPDSSESKKKKKKRKKNKGKVTDSPQAEVPVEAPHAESEIVISVEEQRKFKDAKKTKGQKSPSETLKEEPGSKKKRQAETQDAPNSLDAKRVKFGGKNRAKSYKASMKDLRSIESVSPKTTPDKGILLNKDSVIAVKKNQSKKKRGKRSKNTR